MLQFAEISIGSGASESCVRCHPGMPVAQPIDLETVSSQLATLSDTCPDLDGIWLTGMEPFDHPDLPSIVQAARETGVPRIGLRTNAAALSVAGNAVGVVGAGVTLLEFVLLGHDAESHDTLSGRREFAAVTVGLQSFAQAASAAQEASYLAARIDVCRHNVDTLPLIVATAARYGAVSVTLNAAGAPRDAGPFIEAALETAAVNLMAACVLGVSDVASPMDRQPWSVVS